MGYEKRKKNQEQNKTNFMFSEMKANNVFENDDMMYDMLR
jgi:hypothetical protein